jgi:hypothetical protein
MALVLYPNEADDFNHTSIWVECVTVARRVMNVIVHSNAFIDVFYDEACTQFVGIAKECCGLGGLTTWSCRRAPGLRYALGLERQLLPVDQRNTIPDGALVKRQHAPALAVVLWLVNKPLHDHVSADGHPRLQSVSYVCSGAAFVLSVRMEDVFNESRFTHPTIADNHQTER